MVVLVSCGGLLVVWMDGFCVAKSIRILVLCVKKKIKIKCSQTAEKIQTRQSNIYDAEISAWRSVMKNTSTPNKMLQYYN
jgi:hypothetical protein